MLTLFRLLLCSVILNLPQLARADDWPARPIRLVVPVAAGAGLDILARNISDSMSKQIGVTVFVENVPGASSMIATSTAAKAKPDGYTLLMSTNTALSANMVLFKSLPYDPVKDFVPVAMIADGSGFLVSANPNMPFQDMPSLIAYAKANPGKLKYGVDASSSFAPMIGRALERRAGISLQMVPYKNGAQAVQDAAAGDTQLLIGPNVQADPYFKNGRLRRIAMAGADRFPGAPTVPTIGETLPGFKFDGFTAIVTRTGTDPAIITRLNRAMTAVMKESEIIARVTQLGFTTSGASTPERMETVIREDRELWRQLAQEFKIEPQ